MDEPPLPSEPRRTRLWSAAETAGGAAAWGAIGSVIGGLAALAIPDALVSDATVSGMVGSVFSSLHVLGVLRKRRPRPLERLEAELLNADHLFSRGVIDFDEYTRLRQAILERWTRKSLPPPAA